MKRRVVRPADIAAEQPFQSSCFVSHDAAVAAQTLVLFARHRGSWRDFSAEDLDSFTDRPFTFGGLTRGRDPLIATRGDGKYGFTPAFIALCVEASQDLPMPTKRGNNNYLFGPED